VDELYDHKFWGVAWRLAVAPLPPFWCLNAIRLAYSGWDYTSMYLVLGLLWSLILAIVTVLLGLPLYGVFKRRNIRSGVAFAVGAACIPVAIYVLPELLPRTGSFSFGTRDCQVIADNIRTACGWQMFWQELAVNALGGSVAGLVFWRSLWRRPEKISVVPDY
jgi:hypothetical protein